SAVARPTTNVRACPGQNLAADITIPLVLRRRRGKERSRGGTRFADAVEKVVVAPSEGLFREEDRFGCGVERERGQRRETNDQSLDICWEYF
ncbi:4855_t:CDS:2, partial [Acaulospora colombiana]